MLNQTIWQIQTPAFSIHSYIFQYKDRETPILIVSILYCLDADASSSLSLKQTKQTRRRHLSCFLNICHLKVAIIDDGDGK